MRIFGTIAYRLEHRQWKTLSQHFALPLPARAMLASRLPAYSQASGTLGPSTSYPRRSRRSTPASPPSPTQRSRRSWRLAPPRCRQRSMPTTPSRTGASSSSQRPRTTTRTGTRSTPVPSRPSSTRSRPPALRQRLSSSRPFRRLHGTYLAAVLRARHPVLARVPPRRPCTGGQSSPLTHRGWRSQHRGC